MPSGYVPNTQACRSLAPGLWVLLLLLLLLLLLMGQLSTAHSATQPHAGHLAADAAMYEFKLASRFYRWQHASGFNPQHTCVPGPPPVPAAAVRKPGSGPRFPPAPPAPSCGPLLRSLPVQLLPQLAAWPPPLLSPGRFPVVMHYTVGWRYSWYGDHSGTNEQ